MLISTKLSGRSASHRGEATIEPRRYPRCLVEKGGQHADPFALQLLASGGGASAAIGSPNRATVIRWRTRLCGLSGPGWSWVMCTDRDDYLRVTHNGWFEATIAR